MKSCSWWVRWWHRRLRNLDHVMAETFYRRAIERDVPIDIARGLWEEFKCSPGQDHWHCPCASTHVDPFPKCEAPK